MRGMMSEPFIFAVTTVSTANPTATAITAAVFSARAVFVSDFSPQTSIVTTIPERTGKVSLRFTTEVLHIGKDSGDAPKSPVISGMKNMTSLDTRTVRNEVRISGRARIDMRFIGAP